MATLHTETTRRVDWLGYSISWRAILAGLAVAIAVQLILSLVGTGVGFSFVEPLEAGGTPSAEALGIGATLWWVVSWILSLTAGTIVAVLSSNEITRCRGALLGIVIWALATIAGACLFTNLVGGVFKTTAATVGAASGGAAAGGALLASGLSPEAGNDLRLEVEAFFRDMAPGPDQQQSGESQRKPRPGMYWHALTRYLVNTDENGRTIDRDRAVSALAEAAGVSREQADAEVQKLEDAYAASKEKAKQAADKAAEMAAQFSLWAAFGFLLSLIAAVVAGTCTARSVVHTTVRDPY